MNRLLTTILAIALTHSGFAQQPAALLSSMTLDGTLYISYDRNRSTDGEILLARFTEQDILARETFVRGEAVNILLVCRL